MSTNGASEGRALRNALVAGALGAALAAGALWAADNASGPASAQGPSTGPGGFTLSIAQLRINQRISSAAVRRSNESLGLLDPIRPIEGQPDKVLGWGTTNLVDGAVTGPKIGDGAVGESKIGDGSVTGPKIAPGSVGEDKLAQALALRLPAWALVNSLGNVSRGSPGVTASRPATGDYRVDFGRDVTACGYTATTAAGLIQNVAGISVSAAPGNPNGVRVRTRAAGTADTEQNRAFMIQLTC